jgi:WD40 repeat protein/tetratricopeptide (TPR) repeat protein
MSTHQSTSRKDQEEACARFESAWRLGTPQPIEQFLPAPDDPHFPGTLEELVLIELELLWKARQKPPDAPNPELPPPPLIEDYLRRFPPLNEPSILLRLLEQEYQLRHKFGDRPAAAEYPSRFPGIVMNVQQIIATNPDSETQGPTDCRPAMPLPTIPGYEVLEKLGHGGMGVVYKARHLGLKRLVALKMLLDTVGAEAEAQARFHAEAEAVARFQHPHIVQIFDIGTHEGRVFFSLEFLDGGSLDKKLNRRPQPATHAAEVLLTLARAMHYAHQRGIIHRDLKPANLLLHQGEGSGSPDDSGPSSLAARVKISDFGLAKQLGADSHLTQDGRVMGTPLYMAPEQANGQIKDIGPATDVYALGAILYEMLTGQPPFQGGPVAQLLKRVCEQEPVPPGQLQSVPRDLETICLKCLAKEPERRYRSALLLAQDLERFLAGEPILARRMGPIARAWRSVRRGPRMTAAGIGIGLLTVVVGYAAWLARQEHTATDQVQALSHSLSQPDWTPAQLAAADALVADLDRLAPERSAAARAAVNERLVRYLEDCFQQGRLTRDDVARIDAALLLLKERAPDREPELRERRTRRFQDWETLVDLQAPTFRGWQEILAAQDFTVTGSGLQVRRKPDDNRCTRLLAKARCEDRIQVEMRLDAGWDRGERVGLYLNAGAGHQGVVTCVVFAPGPGQVLASGGDDGIVKLWNATTGQHLAHLNAHNGRVCALAFSPDGSVLASGGADRIIRLWDVAQQRLLWELNEHSGSVTALAFTADGRTLASASGGFADRSEIILWDPAGGNRRRRWNGPAAGFSSLAFAPNRPLLVAGTTNDGRILRWDPETGKEHPPLFHGGGLVSVAFAREDGTLFSASAEGLVKHWNPLTGTELGVPLQGWAAGIYGLAVAPGGRLVAAAHDNALVKLWDPVTGLERGSLTKGHVSRVRCVAIAPDGETIASGGDDGALIIWNGYAGGQRFHLGGGGYAFFLSALPWHSADAAERPREPISFAAARQADETHYLQIVRNGVLQREKAVRVPGGPLQLRAGRLGIHLSLQANDLPALTYLDAQASYVPREGLCAMDVPAGAPLTRLRILRQPLPPEVSPLESGDNLFLQNQFAEALENYLAQTRKLEGPATAVLAVRQEAECKAGLCLLRLNRPTEARALFERLSIQAGKPWPLVATCQLWLLLLRQQQHTEAEQVIESLAKRYRSEDLLEQVPEDLRLDILQNYQPTSSMVSMLTADPRPILQRLERAIVVAEILQIPPQAHARAKLRLLRAYAMLGREGEALDLARSLLTTHRLDTEHVEALEDYAWLMRRRGEALEALTLVDRWLYQTSGELRPEHRLNGYRLLVERARLHVALQAWEKAEDDLKRYFEHIKDARVIYDPYASACLLQGVLRERRKDEAGAREAWQRGLIASWGELPFPLGLPILSPERERPAIFLHLLMAARTERLTDTEVQDRLEQLTHRVGKDTLSGQVLAALPLSPSVLRQMWLTPRARDWARRLAYRDLSFAEFFRGPVVLAGVEMVRQGARLEQPTADQDQVLWDLVEHSMALYVDQRLGLTQVAQLGVVWQSHAGAIVWPVTARGLDPTLRGLAAYMLGHRYEQALKRPEEAIAFFRTARDDAAPDSRLRRLAQAELDRLTKK